MWSFATKLIDADFPIILPNGLKTALSSNSKIIIETPELSAVEPQYLKDFSVQQLHGSHLEEYDVLKHLFLCHYDESIYSKVFKVSKNYLHMFHEVLHQDCEPLVHQDYTTSETNYFNLFDGLILQFFPESDQWKTNESLWKKIGLFCSVWAVFSAINKKDQVKVDDFLRARGIDGKLYHFVMFNILTKY